MQRKAYPNGLNDAEWQLIQLLIEAEKTTQRVRKPVHSKRGLLNALFYLVRISCSWRNLPHGFPPWKTVYTQFRRWQ